MSEEQRINYSDFLESLQLEEIDPFSLASRKTSTPDDNSPIDLTWHQAIADGDPQALENNSVVFRVRFDASASQNKTAFFQQTTEFALKFKANDMTLFESAMADPQTRTHFLENQIRITVWPIFRQQVIDGMTRVGLKSITLPWLFKKI